MALIARLMKCPILRAIAFCLFASVNLPGQVITLTGTNTGYYWWAKDQWMGGSSTSDGFAYGDATGLISAQSNYQYYGGADRSWERKDAYLQVDISSLRGVTFASATLNFYVTGNSSAETFLKHLDTQSVLATGDAGQKLAGNSNVASTTTFIAGWNRIDLTSFIQSDIGKAYDYAVFSIPQFTQSQDENRLLSFYGASATAWAEGVSVKPYLAITAVPEPATYALLGGAIILSLAIYRKRKDRG